MPLRKIAILPIRFYQYAISPMMANHCRFHPSCSHYTLQAVETHGVLRGSWLGAKRLARCNPWNPGGYDPVPPSSSSSMTE